MKKMHIGHKKDRNCIQKCGEDAYRQKKIVVRTRSDKKRDKTNCGEDPSGKKKRGKTKNCGEDVVCQKKIVVENCLYDGEDVG